MMVSSVFATCHVTEDATLLTATSTDQITGTYTQPIFGNIARSAANRQTFANNLVKFMQTYGYDGIDIDWEYPGAPDRGGHPEDVQNFPLMMKTIRETFDRSGRKYGLTYTAPTSFWYGVCNQERHGLIRLLGICVGLICLNS
jgi:GH18 family chitinase